MFDLNPHHLLHASLLHTLMMQGTAILAYIIATRALRVRQARLRARLAELETELALRRAVPNVVAPEAAPGRDDLKEIAGINSKVEALLHASGIRTFAQLALTAPATIRRILENHGPMLHTFDPATWPAQARLAAHGRWTDLRRWQAELRVGQHRQPDAVDG